MCWLLEAVGRPTRRVGGLALVAVLASALSLATVEPSPVAAQQPAGSSQQVVLIGPSTPDAMRPSVLNPGESLRRGHWLMSPNGAYLLILQYDGNLVLYDVTSPEPLWTSDTVGVSDRALTMRPDGNLVLHELNEASLQDPLWQSNTMDRPGAALTLHNDGSATIAFEDGRVLRRIGAAAAAGTLQGADVPEVGLEGVKHVVYGRSAQQVWMVEADGSVRDSYFVSGKATQPGPGRYEVFSKSVKAWAIIDGLTMGHMVRFTHGPNGFAIGFHGIPENGRGVAVQTEDELGQFLSAGCIRQRNDKAEALYDWAPLGTPVVVLA